MVLFLSMLLNPCHDLLDSCLVFMEAILFIQAVNLSDYFSKVDQKNSLIAPTDDAFEEFFTLREVTQREFFKDKDLPTKVCPAWCPC